MRLDAADQLLIGPRDRLDDRVRGLVQRHRAALVAVLAAERTWAAQDWDETAVLVLWARVTRWYGRTGASGGAWVDSCCRRIEEAERARDAAGFWYACQLFVREAARRQDWTRFASSPSGADGQQAVA